MLASLPVKYRCLLTVYFSCAYTFLLGRQLAKHPNEAPSLGSRETSEEAICPEFGITMMSIYIYILAPYASETWLLGSCAADQGG